jgi:hypothetical protein
MFTNLSKIPIKLGILLVGVGLLVAGCDSSPNSAPDSPEEELNISYEVTNDLGDRISAASGDGSSNAMTNQAKASINFEVKSHVNPPDSDERASHLAFSDVTNGSADDKLYIGYKTLGDGYGGGIDIVGLDPGFTGPTGSNALAVDGVDIQEVAVGNDPDALFAATAIEPQSGADNGGLLRAPQFHSIDVNNNGLPPNTSNPDYDAEELKSPDSETRIAKSVTTSSNGAYVVSDVNTFHDISISGSDITSTGLVTESGAEFQSVVDANSGTFVLSDNGSIYKRSGSSFNSPLQSVQGVSSDFGIARLTAHNFSNSPEHLFAALGENGFRIIHAGTGDVVRYDDGTAVGSKIGAVSVTATDNYIFAASGDGLAVYQVDGTNPLDISETSPSTASISDLPGGSDFGGGDNPTDAQVNHILINPESTGSGSDLTLYVAKSTDGVYRLVESGGNVYN